MKLQIANCPECGAPARGTVETVAGLALFNQTGDGEVEYSGETKLYWNAQETVRNPAGDVLVQCPEGHEWYTEVL